MLHTRFGLGRLTATALCAWSLASVARPGTSLPAEVLNVDLGPRIEQSYRFPERFAVDIPHSASASTSGEWTRSGTVSTWHYRVQIPTAVSMSFHARQVHLPASAVLTVTGGGGHVVYRAADVRRGELWSRIFRGATLSLDITVNTNESSQVAFEIASLQAGYRGLGGGVPNHPRFEALKAQAAATAPGCIENYLCHADATNQGPAEATAAIVVGNIGQCTGTLLNNTRGDATPYFLTARHCENGQPGGGNPAAASTVVVYWDATSPCGAALGSIYDLNVLTTSGGTTVIEQQDAWLIRLNSPPPTPVPYFAGWDATGGSFVGGYSVHHAQGSDKQFVSWFGQPVLISIPGTTLNVGFDSKYWGVVNDVGSVGAGASGGALFDSNNRVAGSASLGALKSGAGSNGVCPVSPTPTPSADTVTADFNALSDVWDSTADSTSSTNPATMRSVLDPGGTGQLAIDGFGLAVGATLTSDTSSTFTGQPLTLTWNAPGATTCTASGGTANDGWAGTQPASGTLQVTEFDGGRVSYLIQCAVGNLKAVASRTVDWQLANPQVILGENPSGAAFIGRTLHLAWTANVVPCTASGGLSGDGWAGAKANAGQQDVSLTQLGTVTYSLTCGSGARTATTQYSVDVQPPFVEIHADATQLRIGEPVNIVWNGAPSCSASGGTTGDGWSGPLDVAMKTVTSQAPGTVTYTITCSGGSLSASTSATVTYTGDAAAATLVTTATPLEVVAPVPGPAGYVPPPNLAWTANVRPCALTYAGPGTIQGSVALDGTFPAGTAAAQQTVAGTYLYTMTCGTGANVVQATSTIDWFTTSPSVTLTSDGATVVANLPFQLGWTSNIAPCTGSGGSAGDGWAGAKASAVDSQSVTEATPGTYTFVITCGSGSSVAQAQSTVTVPAPSVSLNASRTSGLYVNDLDALSWNATTVPCVASSAPANPNWTGTLPFSSSVAVTENVPGTYTYTITCGSGALTAQASVQVTYDARPAATASLTASATSVNVNDPVTLTWTSTNAASCVGSTTALGTWAGGHDASGVATVTSSAAGSFTYGINCNGATAQVQVQYQPVVSAPNPSPSPTVSLSADATTRTVGQSIMLSWSSQNASACTGSGGSVGDGWSGSLPLAGSQPVTESAAGTYSYTITCDGAPPAASASVTATFNSATPPPPPSSGGGGGGGGSIDALSLLLLSFAGALRWTVGRESAAQSAVSRRRRRCRAS